MRYILILILIFLVNCKNNSKECNKKNNLIISSIKNETITNNSFKNIIVEFIKVYPRKYANIEGYMITFCVSDFDTIISIDKTLIGDKINFIDNSVEFKGWFDLDDNLIYCYDKKINPIGNRIINYSELSKIINQNNSKIEYHGQKWLNEIMCNKQYIYRKGEFILVKNKKFSCYQ